MIPNNQNDDSLSREITEENPLFDDVLLPSWQTFWKIFKKISKLSITMGLSYTASFELVLITLLMNYWSQDEENIAAATLISTMMYLGMLAGSPLFAISNIATPLFGALKAAENANGLVLSDEEIEKKRIEISKIYKNGLLLSTITVLPLAPIFIFSKDILINILGQNEASSETAQEFLLPYAFAIPAVAARVCAEQIIFTFKHGPTAMRMGLINFIIGTITSIWLGFGGFGVKKLGPLGFALGDILQTYLTAICFTSHIAINKDFAHFKFFSFFKNTKGNSSQFLELCKKGASIFFARIPEITLPLITGLLAGLLSTLDQSTWNFAMQLVFLTAIISAAFGQGCAQELGRELGAKNYISVSQTGRFGLLTTFLWTIPIPCILAVFPNILTSMLSEDLENIEHILKYLMPIISTGVIFNSIRNNLLQQLRHLGDMNIATLFSVGNLSLGMILAGVLGLKTEMGIYGIATGYSIGFFLASLCLFPRWLQRIKLKTIQETQSHSQESPSKINLFCCLYGKSVKEKQNDETQPLIDLAIN